jgi:hypothetical protein
MKTLRYVSAQPASDYYTWQVEVMINNFMKYGINPNTIDVVCAIKGGHTPPNWRKLADTYNTVRFFFYEDDRVDSPYVSAVRPNILKKHFAAHPEMKEEAIFYHDCDIVFTQKPDWSAFVDDDTWYCSDARFYVGAEYIEGKKDGLYDRMCEIVGIDPEIPRMNELNSGGAQYIMKNIDAAFWQKVEDDSNNLYQFFLDHLKIFPETPKRHPIQKWTADMWAVLWGGFMMGQVRVVPEMEFCWATQELKLWQDRVIFHNAGVLNTEKDTKFYKGEYTGTLPYHIENTFDPNLATHYYVKEIQETAKVSCLIDHGVAAPA